MTWIPWDMTNEWITKTVVDRNRELYIQGLTDTKKYMKSTRRTEMFCRFAHMFTNLLMSLYFKLYKEVYFLNTRTSHGYYKNLVYYWAQNQPFNDKKCCFFTSNPENSDLKNIFRQGGWPPVPPPPREP